MRKTKLTILTIILLSSIVRSQTLNIPDNLGVSNNPGKVGIGTNSPSGILHIKNDNLVSLDLQRQTANSQWRFSVGNFGSDALYIHPVNSNEKIIFSNLDREGFLFINSNNGFIGLGIDNPTSNFHIKGLNLASFKIQRQTVNSKWKISVGNFGTDALYIHPEISNEDVIFANIDRTNLLTLKTSSGNVGIGTSTPNYKLDVAGIIRACEVKVNLESGECPPDYVFEDSYNLMEIRELEKYIKTNKHLPEINSGEQMKTEGVDLKEMNMLLLKKIEEMTLYMIEQNKKTNELETKVNELTDKNETLEKVMDKLISE